MAGVKAWFSDRYDIPRIYKDALNSMEFYLDKYGSSEQGKRRMLQAVLYYVRWCFNGGFDWRDPEAVERFLLDLRRRVSGSTLKFYYRVLKVLFRINSLKFPYEKPPRKQHYPKRHYLTIGEMVRLARAAEEAVDEALSLYPRDSPFVRTALMDRAMLFLALDLGLRRQEIRAMNVGDVDFRRRMVYVRTAKYGNPKWQPVSGRTIRAIVEYLKVFGRVHPKQPLFTPRRRLSLTSISISFERSAKRAGIYRKGLGWHSIRRGLATALFKQAGLRERELQELLRWRTPTMPHLYIQDVGEAPYQAMQAIRPTEMLDSARGVRDQGRGDDVG